MQKQLSLCTKQNCEVCSINQSQKSEEIVRLDYYAAVTCVFHWGIRFRSQKRQILTGSGPSSALNEHFFHFCSVFPCFSTFFTFKHLYLLFPWCFKCILAREIHDMSISGHFEVYMVHITARFPIWARYRA